MSSRERASKWRSEREVFEEALSTHTDCMGIDDRHFHFQVIQNTFNNVGKEF